MLVFEILFNVMFKKKKTDTRNIDLFAKHTKIVIKEAPIGGYPASHEPIIIFLN